MSFFWITNHDLLLAHLKHLFEKDNVVEIKI